MKRKFVVLTLRNTNGRSLWSSWEHNIAAVLERASRCPEVTTITEDFILEINHHEQNDKPEECNICGLDLDLCNCKLIEPDPTPHRTILSF